MNGHARYIRWNGYRLWIFSALRKAIVKMGMEVKSGKIPGGLPRRRNGIK